MQFARDPDNRRITPAFSGQRAKCETCGGELNAHYGEFRVHWQHLNIDRDCDPWKENETQWHRDWKAEFPKDWQEAVIENEFEKHRADVKTKFGLVIEFQNSSIQSTTIKIREEFYGNMIWVINAKEFSERFKLYSTVKNRLRDLDSTTDNTFLEVEKFYDNLQKGNKEEVRKIKNQISELEREISISKSKIEYHKPIQEQIEKLTTLILTSWKDNDCFYDSNLDKTLLKKVEETYKEVLTSFFQKLKKLESIITKNNQRLKEIESMEDIEIEGVQMKILSYERIPQKLFAKVKAISPKTKNILIPETVSFNSEIEFQSFSYRKNQYLFAINALQSILDIKSKLNELTLEKESIEKDISNYTSLIMKTINDEFARVLIESKNSILQTYVVIEKLKTEIEKCNQRIDRLTIQRENEIHELTKEKEEELKKKRSQIMTKFKGLYHFDWKHKRPSWSVSKRTIYFDTGKGFLLEKISDEKVRKVDKSDFVKKLMTPLSQV